MGYVNKIYGLHPIQKNHSGLIDAGWISLDYNLWWQKNNNSDKIAYLLDRQPHAPPIHQRTVLGTGPAAELIAKKLSIPFIYALLTKRWWTIDTPNQPI